MLSSKEQTQYETVLQAVISSAEKLRIHNCKPKKIMADFEKAIINAAEKLRIHNYKPKKIMADFEKAIINAAWRVDNETQVSCCFFHLGQSMYRRIQSEGLQEEYNHPENRELKTCTHMILALAFVPEADVKKAFEELLENVPESLLPVMDYFEENYRQTG